MKRWLIFLLAVPAALFVLAMLAFSALVLSFFPAYVTWTAVALMAVVGLWLLLHRRAGGSVLSEGSLIGRQNTKDGLL